MGKVIALAVVAAAVGGGYYQYQKSHKARVATEQAAAALPKPGVPVSVLTAKASSFTVRLEGLGSVQPVNTVVVRSRVDGQIEQVFFKEGQLVKQGDLLLRIDARPFQAALSQAQAKLAQDQATLKNSSIDLQRYSTLEQQQIASKQKLEAQQTAVATGNAIVQADQAVIDNAKVQVGYTEIRSPLSGRIGFRQVDSGNIVRANDTQGLLSIVQMDPINVLYTLPESDLATVSEALSKGPVKVVATVVGQRVTPQVEGTVGVVNNTVDQASGTVQIKAVFNNKEMKLWPGQAVTTQTQVKTLDNVIVVPTNIVQHGPNGLFVWRIGDGNIALPDSVRISEQDGNNAVISSGLSIDDKIVTAGQLRLRKGVKVEIREGTTDQQAQLAPGGATP